MGEKQIQRGVVTIYGAGGCGVNLAALVNSKPGLVGHAEVKLALVDTSLSNLKEWGDQKQVYTLDGVDGSGKVRRDNSEAIADSIGDLLLEHPAGDFSIVCFSASGGSGSVFGPLIVKALLERNKPVVAFVVESRESAININNTLNTLKTLEAISAGTKSPLVMYFASNPTDQPRSVVDTDMVAAIQMLIVLASRQNAELDTRDLENFLRYDRVSRAQPQLSLMDIVVNNDPEVVREIGVKHVISMASIHASTDTLPLGVKSEYRCEGYYPSELQATLPASVHFLVHNDEMSAIIKSIRDEVKAYDDFAGAQTATTTIKEEKDQVDKNMLVL